jgi:4-amino-4-deoxychorismate lyase
VPAILINGQPAEHISVLDRGFQYGDGLFETLHVVAGKPRRWQRHMARLAEGCRRLHIDMPDTALLLDEAESLCHGRADAVLKIIVTRGSGERGYAPPAQAKVTRVVSVSDRAAFPASYYSDGVAVRVCATRLASNPALAGIKHLNRLEQVLARSEWDSAHSGIETDQQIAEGLMLDNKNNVIEGTMSNLFCVQAGEHGPLLKTPLLDQCGVRGIARDCLLEAAAEAGMSTQETTLSLDDVHQSQEVFLSNSLIGVWPVRRLENQAFPVGPVTTQLSQALELIHD